jgi:SSS family transporter
MGWRREGPDMTLPLAGIFIYILIQLLIGLLVSRGIRNEDDYYLAGRRLGYGLGTFTIFATWFGAETCIGSAGSVYRDGLSGGTSDPFGYSLCLLLMGTVFAVPLWKKKLTTLADLFRTRYSRGVERLAVLLMVPTSVLWAAAQIRAFGQVLSASSALDVNVAITCAAAVVIIYTAAGGLMADALTDLVQGIALIVGLAVLAGIVVFGAGGPGAALGRIEPSRLDFGGSAGFLGGLESWSVPILGSVVAQELVSRISAVRSPEVARRATLMATGVYFVVGLIPVFLGLIGPHLLPGLAEPEQILPQLGQNYLPTLLYVLFAGALVSAILSTVDSTLLAAGTLTAHNIIVPLMPRLDDRGKVRLARAAVAGFGGLAYVLALHAEGVYHLVETASAFGSAGIFTIFVFGLFTGYGSSRSAVLALVAGMGVWLYGTFVGEWSCPYLASLLASLGAYLLGSLDSGRRGARPATA